MFYAVATVMVFIFAAAVIGLLCGKSLCNIWNIIDMLQFYSFMLYLNINLPFNVKQFFGIFNHQKVFPNLVKLCLEHFQIEYETTNPANGLYHFNTFFLENINWWLCFFAITTAVWIASELVMLAISKVLKKKKCLCLRKCLIWNGFYRLVSVGYLQIVIFGLLTIQEYNVSTTANKISLYSAMTLTSICCLLPFAISLTLYKGRNKLETQDFKDKYGSFYSIYKQDTSFNISFEAIRL